MYKNYTNCNYKLVQRKLGSFNRQNATFGLDNLNSKII